MADVLGGVVVVVVVDEQAERKRVGRKRGMGEKEVYREVARWVEVID